MSSKLRHSSKENVSLEIESLEDRMMLSSVSIIAAGVENTESIELQIDSQTVATFDNLGGDAYAGQFQTYDFTTAETISADQVRVRFTNDLYDADNNVDRNVRVDAIVIDGVRYETEDPSVFSTGTWLPEDGIVPGNRESEYLHTDGYFQFADSDAEGSLIQVLARGSEGVEQFELQIDGVTAQTFTTSAEDQTFVFRASDTVTADQIRIQFINDVYDPDNGIDNNLIVDSIAIDGEVFETEAPSTFSTGTWLPEDGIVPGNRESEWLHTDGYFQYGEGGTVAQPGVIGLTLDSLTVNEDLGELNFVVFRSAGSDGDVSVDYTTVFGTADSNDLTPISGTLVFEDGINSQQVSLQITDDELFESAETFTLSLSNPTGGATLGAISSQVVTINDNDDEPVVGIIFEDSFESVSNWTTNASGTDTATTGQWEIGSPQSTTNSGITLQPNSGHTGPGALVTGLAAGSSVGTFDIDSGVTSVLSPVIDLPDVAELELSFEYSLAYLDNASNDDYFSASIVSGGVTTELFDDHAHDANQESTWNFVNLDISAYAGQSIQIQFEAADLLGASLVEAAVDDVVIEALPTLPGTIEVFTTSVNLDEDAGSALVVLKRASGRVGEVSVDYTTSPDTASQSDFGAVSGTAVFQDGQAEVEILIPIVDDTIEESLESFQLTLSNPTGGAILGSNNAATITIVDNDNSVGDYLPDLTPIASTLTERLSIDTTEQPGRRLMRFSTEVANAGDGPLEIWGGEASGSSQQVFQRIYQEDGGSRDRLAGEFVYHAGHGHIHFEGFATYDLKLTDASGAIVASGGKTSFCLINIRQPFTDVTANAGVVHGRGGESCGQVQGISAGYSDVYSASLDDQWIDVTNVADGVYWLEIETDPENNIQETNENNNTARVQVRLQNGQVTGL